MGLAERCQSSRSRGSWGGFSGGGGLVRRRKQLAWLRCGGVALAAAVQAGVGKTVYSFSFTVHKPYLCNPLIVNIHLYAENSFSYCPLLFRLLHK